MCSGVFQIVASLSIPMHVCVVPFLLLAREFAKCGCFPHLLSYPHLPRPLVLVLLALPQDFQKAEDKSIMDADDFRACHEAARERRAAGLGGAAAGAASSTGGDAAGAASSTGGGTEAGPASLPKRLTVASARPLMPQTKGALLWYEGATDRVRVAYLRGQHKKQWSFPVVDDERSAILLCLQWAWQEHRDCTGKLPACKELRTD